MDPASDGNKDDSLFAELGGAKKGPERSMFQLESLKQEYEAQLDHLREQLATERKKHDREETDQHMPKASYKETTDHLRQGLGSDQQAELDHAIQSIEDMHKKEMDIAHQQHVDDINLQVKAMRLTLEQIYTSQLDLVRADLENQHSQSMDTLRENLTKEHKSEINRLEADWSAQMAELEEEHSEELNRSLLEDAVGSEQSKATYIQSLNQKLANEHRKLLEKISEDLGKGANFRKHTPKKKRKPGDITTESEDGDTETESIHSMPVTGEEYQQVEEREKLLDRVEDVRETLEAQREEIATLRAAMLTEYEQLLALRTESMASHTQEVEKMQHDMEDLQKTYEEKIQEFQAKVESKTGEALRLTVTEQHNKELEILQSVYEQKLLDLQENFAKERVQHQEQIDHLMSLQQEVSSAHAQQEAEPTVTSSDENVKPDKESSSLPAVELVSELESKLAEKDSTIEKLTSQITEMKENYEMRDTGLSNIEKELTDKCKELEEMKKVLVEKDNKIIHLKKEKCEVEEKCAKDMQESEKKYSSEIDEITSRLIDIQAELDASREQERMLEEQYEELQHQHVLALEGAHEDFNHEKHVEVGSLQSEFQVQLEIELKRQAADLAIDHEEKLKEIAKSYEEKIQQLKTDFDEKLVDITTRASDASPDVEDKDTDTEKSTILSQEVQSDVVDSRNDEDAASSKASTVIEVSSDKMLSRRQGSDNSMESDQESEIATPRGGKISPEVGSAMSYETEEESLSQDITPGSDEADTTQDTTQDTDSETVSGLFKEISKAKEDTLSFLRAEYEQKITALDDRLRQVMAENVEYEKDMEALKEQLEDVLLEKASTEQKLSEMKTNYENKLKDIELSSRTSDIDKVRQEYAKEYDENVSQIRREFEEKMDLLRLELQESFETEKDDLVKEHRKKMNDIEEKYENLIESVRSGDAPEVADIVRDRIDTELEMAKTLMQQEFDETIEAEQARMMEQQQQELDDLQSQHESDIAECRKTLQDQFETRLQELEQLHVEEMSKLQQELANLSMESMPQESDSKQDTSNLPNVDENHAELVAQITESLNEKHKKDLATLESHYDAKIKDLEDRYSGEISQLMSRLESHLTINTGTMELAGVVSPVHSVPRLSLDKLDQKGGMEGQGTSSDDQSSVPTRSTPRDLDSERSVDRSETMETLLPPAQISPTSEALSDRDHDSLKSEELMMRFDSESEDNGMEERPGARLGHVPSDQGDFSSEDEIISSPSQTTAPFEVEFIIPNQTSVQSMLPGQATPSEEESKELQMEEKEQDESEADRSASPADILLQTQSLAGFTLPASTIGSSTGSRSADFQETLLMEVKEKDEKIKQLEAEIQALNGQLKKQTEEENLILLRREREAQEDQNLEELLRQDVSRVNKERDAIQQTNEHLLQLLSDAVKTFMSVEEVIGKKLSKIVVDTGDQSGQSGVKSPRSAEQSQGSPEGAEGGEFHDSGDVPQETSILSNDEGLDLSQRLCESIFLDSEGEELLTDASQRLQGSVTRLLDMIEDTTHQLTDARRTQHDLVSTLSSGQQESQSLESRCQEMEDRLREQVEAKEFLALELHKAEGLIEGYSAEREMLELRIQDLEEQKEALVLELETTRNKLGDLETVHHEATSLRAEIQRQHNLVQENAGEEAQALMLEVHRVNEEKRDLAQKLRELQENYDHRVRELENAGEETERHYVALLEEKKAEMNDLRLQLDASEKQNKANRQFMEEEAVEREKEREEYQREIASWKQKILDSQKEKKVETRLQRQVDDLTEQLQSQLDRDSEFEEQTAQLQRDLHDKQMSAEDMRALVLEQEKDLEERSRMEDILRQKLRDMEEELSKQHRVNTELSDIIKLPPNIESDEEETEDGNGGRTTNTRHRRLLPSQLSLQQEEELLHEKEALQRRVEQLLKQISALENKLDTMRHRGSLDDDSQTASLQRQLERQTEIVESRDKQVVIIDIRDQLEEQKEQIEDLAGQLVNKERLIQQLTEHIESTEQPEVKSQPDRDTVIEKLQDENMEMTTKIKSLQNKIASTPMPVLNQSLIMEKNQEIDHLNNQIEQLNYEIERLRSGQEIARLQAEVDRQQAELEQSKTDMQFLRASQASTFSGDGSDVEVPGVTDSFSEKTNLQQEIQDSLKHEEEAEEIRTELHKSRSELEKRNEEFGRLGQEFESQFKADQTRIQELTVHLEHQQTEISDLKERLTKKEALQAKADPSSPLDHAQLKDIVQEKESQIEQMTIQIESLNAEVESLNDFQTKLAEDFDLVQSMLEEKERDIDLLTKELTEKSAESPSALTALELEISKLQRELKERDNVIDEKAEEMYLLNEKIEQQEVMLTDLKTQSEEVSSRKTPEEVQELLKEKEGVIQDKDQEIVKLQDQLDAVNEHLKIAENLQRKLEEAGLVGPDILMKEKDTEIQKLKDQVVDLKEKLKAVIGDEGLEIIQGKQEELIEQIKELEASRLKNETQISLQKEEIVELRNELEATTKRKNDEVVKHKEEIEELKKELSSQSSETEVTELRMEIAGLEDKLQGFEGQDVTELRREITQLNEETTTKDGVIQRLQEEVTSLRQEDTADTESELESLREEVVQLKQDLHDARTTEPRIRQTEAEGATMELPTQQSQQNITAESVSTVSQGKLVGLVPQTSMSETEPREVTEEQILPEISERIRSPPSGRDSEETIEALESKVRSLEKEVETTQALKEKVQGLEEVVKTTKGLEEKVRSLEKEAETSQTLKEEVSKLEKKIANYKSQEEKLQGSASISSNEKSEDFEIKIKELEEELDKYRGLEVSQVVEDLKEKDEEISILREALNAMKSGEEDLNNLLREKDDSLMEMEGKLEGMRTDGEVSEGDKLLQDKMHDVTAHLAAKESEYKTLQDEYLQATAQLSDAITTLQQKEEKLSQTSAQLSEREEQLHSLQGELQLLQQESDENHIQELKSELQEVKRDMSLLQTEKEAEFEDMKEKLTQAVEFSEAQLQLVEEKEEDYVKLKLEMQEANVNYDRAVRDLQQQLERSEAEREDEVTSVKNTANMAHAQQQKVISDLQNQIQQLKAVTESSVGAGDAVATVTSLQTEIREKNEAVEVLEKELEKSKLAVEEKAEELEKILEELQRVRTSQVRNEEELEAKAQELDLVYADLHNSKQSLKTTVDELERKAQELETRAQEVAKLRGELDQSSGIGLDLDIDVIPEVAQKRISSLQMELNMSKAALLELQQQDTSKPQDVSQVQSVDGEQREPPVLRLRSDSQESEEDFSTLDTATLRLKMVELTQELKQTSSELELFRSSASLTAKDYVRKVMELREELSHQHQRHIHDIQERAHHEKDTTLMQLRIRYDDEIEHLHVLQKKELEKKVGEVKRDLDKQHKAEINRLVARHKQEMDLAKVQEPVLAHDHSTMEHVERLQAEISLSEKLDNRLRQSLSDTAQGQGQADTGDAGSIAASTATDLSFNENVPARLQNLMERLHKENVQLLSMSELQFLNRHLGADKVDKEADITALRSSWDNEKQSLMSAIGSLKDLLSQTHKLRGLDKDNEAELSDFSAEITDWRGELLQSVGYVFAKERETLLAELRTHVMSHPNTDLTEIHKLEKKIRNSESHQRSALDQIFHADRQSLLAEVRDLRAHINICQIRSQEERERLSDQLNEIEDQGNKQERQLKRQVKLLEYKLQQEKILQDDIRTSLESERERTTELSSSLSREKMSNLDHQTDVANLNLQVTKLKESLEREQSRFVSVTQKQVGGIYNDIFALGGALEEEKGKCHTLGERLEAEKYKVRDLKNDLEDAKVRSEVRDKINSTIEKLESDLMTERDLRIKMENSHELDRVKINALQQDLNTERKNLQMFEAEYETKVTELKTALELEKIRAADLVSALEKEQTACHNLRQSLYEQQNSAEKSDNKGIVEDLQVALKTEKALVMDLRGALEHDKHRMAGMVAAVKSERTAMQDELQQERETTRQIKHDIDTLQLQNLEFTRMFEREREQVSRLKAEREQLRSEVKAIQDADNERERLRDTEKLSERRRLRQVERERDDHKMKLHEQTLEAQRLTQKVLDLQDQLAQSREKELDAIRDLEQERLSTIQSQFYDGFQHNGSPRGTPNTNHDQWNVYKAQLQSLSQSLQYLILQYRDSLDRSSKSDGSREMQHALSDLLSELKQLQMPLEFESQNESNLLARPNPSVINERVLRHNADLTSFVTRLTEEKMDLRNSLGQMEEQLWHQQQRGTTHQNGNTTDGATNQFEERANWAKERLSLQLTLNDAEQRIDQLTANLRMERDRRSVMGSSGSESDREKIQRLYGKYLRAESFRKALVYQKKYLLLLLGGFQDCEETTLAMLAQMGAYPSPEDVNQHQHRRRPYNIFRSAARVIVAVTRMKYLVKKWRRATRVGSPVVGGSVNTQQAYMPTDGSFSPPRLTSGRNFSPPRINGSPPYNSNTSMTRPSQVTFSASLPPGDSDSNSPSSYQPIASRPSAAVGSTPPTKEYSLTRHVASRDSKSGARRKLLSLSHQTKPSSHSSESSHGNQGATSRQSEQPKEALHDDYIKRLESLQKTLSNMSSSSGTPRRGSSMHYH
ncbi:A-kinase anchor protein 9-like [Ylistrum balloti]|uniref:A-kinase anchor protein 9-like n=1 Tax=Ylistrum balloti TaxID=509963 RepID=UPI002905AFBE|nr:A-kinase anchor protein 9-like [Ylistrum balloti]